MLFQPTHKLTGKQIISACSNARDAVIAAHALEVGDFNWDQYEEKYGSQATCSPSSLTGMCIWSVGNWQMYEAIRSLA